MAKLTILNPSESYALVILKQIEKKERKAFYKKELYKDLSPKARKIAEKIIKGEL